MFHQPLHQVNLPLTALLSWLLLKRSNWAGRKETDKKLGEENRVDIS